MKIDLTKAEAFNAIAWILKNKIINENGSQIEFSDHTFLIDPYMDNSPKQAIMKAAQIGWSTLAILRSFHLARFAGANIIHTFPSRNISKDFVVPKVNPLILRNPTIQALIGVDSLNLKQIGERFIYYRGSYEQTEAISISAHILINDEFDRSNQKVLKVYRSRLDDAKRERPELGWEWRFSNPSIPGYGVHEFWQKSDQKHWFVKCRKCGYDWYLKFPDNINFETKERICAKCHFPLTADDLRNGRWVKKYLNREVSGYWISQLFVPWISASKIIEDSEDDPEIFHNFTLGLPYVSQDTSVNRQTIFKCCVPGFNTRTDVAMGVDNGVTKTYVIGNRAGIFEVGETKSWQEIENLRNRYRAAMVVDANPYPNVPIKLASKYPGKVYIHYYQQDKKGAGIIQWSEDGVVKSDRTKVIDFVVSELNSQDISFNVNPRELEEYVTHWENMYRVVEPNPQGIRKSKWKTIEARPDHFAHATIYWRIALEQTLGGGTVVQTNPEEEPGHPEVLPGKVVPALNLEQRVKRIFEHPHRSWKVT